MTRKKTGDISANLFEEVLASFQGKGGIPIMKLQEMQSKYGVTRYCSTGYPSWDLHMPYNEDRTQYGWPYGRVSEIFGAQGSIKTRTVYEILAENIKLGGHSYFLTSELDFDESYIATFLKKRGIDKPADKLDYAAVPCTSMETMFEAVGLILERYIDQADKLEKKGLVAREVLPPIAIGVDSIGAMISHGDKEKLEKDGLTDGPRVGQKAMEIHRFFQNYLLDFARLGVLFVYTNHYRDNIQSFGRAKKHVAAHESALKYYPSVRCEMLRGYSREHQKDRTSHGVSYRDGWIWKCRIDKIRGPQALAGEFEIPFYENIGLDWVHSLIEASLMSDVIRYRAGIFTLEFEEGEPLEKYNDKLTEKDFRKLIIDDAEFRVLLEDKVLRTGAKVHQEL